MRQPGEQALGAEASVAGRTKTSTRAAAAAGVGECEGEGAVGDGICIDNVNAALARIRVSLRLELQQRWRETFAEKLRGWGIDAEATRQVTRGRGRNHDPLWRLKAREDGRLRTDRAGAKRGATARANWAEVVEVWMQGGRALAVSADATDRDLARSIATFIKAIPATLALELQRQARDLVPQSKPIDFGRRR